MARDISELRADDRLWLDNIVYQYYGPIKRSAYHIAIGYELPNMESWAEDMTQEVFLCLSRRASEPAIRHHENIGGWLFVTLHNIIGNEWQKSYHREIPVTDVWAQISEESYELECTELFPPGLSEEDRKILLWCDVQGLPHKVVAEHLGCSEAASRMRLRRAEVRFKKAKSFCET